MALGIPISSDFTRTNAKAFLQQVRELDNAAVRDLDDRADFVELQGETDKLQVMLQPNGFVARQSGQHGDVTVARCELPRWFEFGKQFSVEVVCRSAQGAYSGFLDGHTLSQQPADQEAARQVFYSWQKPLKKPGDDG